MSGKVEVGQLGDEPIPQSIVDRFWANVRQAGIGATADDIAEMYTRGYFQNVVAFERLVASYPADALPDYLAEHGPSRESATAGPQGEGANLAPPGRYPPLAPRGLKLGEAAELLSIAEMAALLRARRVSPVDLTKQSLAAIERHDAELNAFQVVVAERALAAARRAEAEIVTGQYRGPLHGVPVAIKDLLAMRGTETTAGSRILAGESAEYDAAAVERLEVAGAVIVGKTRMSEFAYSPGSNNAHYGPTRNPWHLQHDTGGSSSGSASAVAAGMVPAALGSDTGGSIRIPASQCGLVGLKPTYGRVSLHGAVTLSWSLDHLGPLTRTVADTALLLDALAGRDPRDGRTRPVPPVRFAADGIRGLRVGVPAEAGSAAMPATAEALAAWRAGLTALAGAGATLIEVSVPDLAGAVLLNSTILVLEGIAFHQQFLRDRLDEYGEFPRRRFMRAYAFGPNAPVQAQQARAVLRSRCEAIFETVDLLSTPTMPAGAPKLGVPAEVTFTAPFNFLGWPAISVPVGRTDEGLPLGLQLAGKPWDEATVLRAAAALEASGIWLVPPGS
jgi:aspartyl-tRNA(Asn)/glutamyl-tRNA(Gln) amidotransferase subunit A